SLPFYFFFQAEDGIRDFHVTGVQTCALPIWRLQWADQAELFAPGHEVRREGPCCVDALPEEFGGTVRFWFGSGFHARAPLKSTRSEERRVGKECRSRGFAEHSEQKQITKRRV